MILETVEVHNSPNSRFFGLRPTVAAGFLGQTEVSAARLSNRITVAGLAIREQNGG